MQTPQLIRPKNVLQHSTHMFRKGQHSRPVAIAKRNYWSNIAVLYCYLIYGGESVVQN